MKYIFVLLVTVVLAFACLGSAAGRESVNMNFDWKFKKGDHPGAEAVDFNDKSWRDVQVPHDWSIEGPFAKENALRPANENFTKWVVWVKDGGNGFMPTGIGWYRKKFNVSKKLKNKRLFLEFDGIFRNATIYLNGKPLTNWLDIEPIKNPILDNPLNVPEEEYEKRVEEAKEIGKSGKTAMYNPGDYDTSKNWVSGYIPLVIDITDHVTKGDNTLVVKCDTRLREGWWYEGAGIYRSVRLLVTDPVHVAKWGTFVTTPEITAEAAMVKMATTIQNDSDRDASCILETTLVSQDGKTVARTKGKLKLPAGTKKTFDQKLTVKSPTVWSIDNPYMYKALTKITMGRYIVDEYETPFGIRTFHFDPALGFFLNSKYYRLDGVCNHDCIAALGVAIPPRVHYEGIKFLRDAGGKFYRAAHNPRSTAELDACDKYGIIIANESRYFDNTDFAKKMLKEFILYSRNHPSIMMWSLGNEEEKVQGQPRGVEIAKDLFKVIKAEDTTRAISIAQNRKVNWPGGFSDMFDVLGCNWRGAPDMADDYKKYPKRAVYVSEYNYGGGTWETFAQHRNIAGSSTWTGFDYRGEGGWPGVWWPGHIGDNLHYPAKNYGLALCQWGDEPVVWLDHNWGGKEGSNVKIRGYSNCDKLIAYAGGTEVKKIDMPGRPNKKGFFTAPECRFDFDLSFQSGKDIKVVGYLAGKKVAERSLKPLGKPIKILLEPSSLTMKSDGEDVAIVKISIVDENGNLIRKTPGSDGKESQLSKEIKVDVKGAGYLLATANTAKSGDIPGVASSLAGGNPWTYDGYCQAIIRSNGKEGKVTVTASTVDGSMKLGTIEVLATKDADPTKVEMAKASPVSFDSKVKGGFVVDEPSLPEKNVKADVSTAFSVKVENVGSYYPLEVSLSIDGEKPTSDKFSVELGRKRIIKFDGPRLYKGGKHSLKITFKVNGKEIKTVEKTLNVKETKVAYFVDTKPIPSSVFKGEKFSFVAPVRNTGSKSSDGIVVPVILDGKKQAGPMATLESGETGDVKFTVKVPDDAKDGQEFTLNVGTSVTTVKVINPAVGLDELEVYGAPKQVSGNGETKALNFDGVNNYIKIKDPVDLNDKLFTICVWFKHERAGEKWESGLPIISGSKGGLRAGANNSRDAFWAYAGRNKWRHPKPEKGKWIFHCYQLKGRYLPKQTGGIMQEDGTMSNVQAAKTTDMGLMLYHNGKRNNADRIPDNDFYKGNISYIGSFWGAGRFEGDIDDVKIYDRALSNEEIKGLHEEGLVRFPAVRDGLVFWLDFEGDDFGSIPDRKPSAEEVEAAQAAPVTSAPSVDVPVQKAKPNKYPAAKKVYLKVKDAKSAKQGWSDPKQDKTVMENPIRIAGLEYEKGIGTHAAGEIVYDLAGKGYKRFYAKVGVDDESDGTLGYEVYLDGKKLFESGNMAKGNAAKTVDVDIAGGKQLKLIVTLGADGESGGDHADWADACFIR